MKSVSISLDEGREGDIMPIIFRDKDLNLSWYYKTAEY